MEKNWEIQYIVSVKNENDVTTVKVLNSHEVVNKIQEYYDIDRNFTNVRAEKHNKELKKILHPFLIDIKLCKDENIILENETSKAYEQQILTLKKLIIDKDNEIITLKSQIK